jgi:hypothetical protein
MKKLRNLCIAIIALVGLSFSANAQNSGTTPAIGTDHDYWVNANLTGTTYTGVENNTYQWYVTVNGLDFVTNLAPASDLTVANVTGDAGYIDANTAVAEMYRINLTWLAPSADGLNTYYLHVIETNALNGGCSNHKVQIIDPFSDFQLAIINLDVDLANAADDINVCAPNVAPSINGSTIEYSYGTTTLYYKVDATNIDAADYVLGYNIDVNDAFTGTVATSYSTNGGTSYSDLPVFADAADKTQAITNVANSSEVIIKVELVNGAGFEGIVNHDVIVKLVSGAQGVALASIPGDVDKQQFIPARPSTSDISSN